MSVFLAIGVLFLALVYFVSRRAQKHSATTAVKPIARQSIAPVPASFRWDTCEPYYMRPFAGKRNYNPSMGVRDISQNWDQLFLIEKTYLDCTNLRREYLKQFEKKILHCHDNQRLKEALVEFYDMAIGFMLQKYPQYFKMSETNSVVNLINNDRFPRYGSTSDPTTMLRVIAGNFEEDVLIMLKDNPEDESEEYILRANLTGSPAGFDPSHNFDRPISFIHKPVPQYQSRLGNPMHRFFNKLKPESLWQRANWSVQTNNVLLKLDGHHSREGDKIEELSLDEIDFENSCFMRCERQILTRLPESHAVIMLVRTYLTPIKDIKKEGFGEEMANAIEALPEDLAFYKLRGKWGKAVCQYLRQ